MREPFGVILGGGLGTRMGGLEKAGIRLGGVRLLDRCIDRLSDQVDGMALSTNNDIQTDLPCLPDRTPDRQGPLAGVLAGLDHASALGHSHIVTVAVDTPFFPCDLVPRLMLAALDQPDGFAIAATPDSLHPTFGLWPVRLRDALAEALTQGQRKVRTFTETHKAATATFAATQPDAFFNINTPEDLVAAEGWL